MRVTGTGDFFFSPFFVGRVVEGEECPKWCPSGSRRRNLVTRGWHDLLLRRVSVHTRMRYGRLFVVISKTNSGCQCTNTSADQHKIHRNGTKFLTKWRMFLWNSTHSPRTQTNYPTYFPSHTVTPATHDDDDTDVVVDDETYETHYGTQNCKPHWDKKESV
jgi:hypothetical protein